MVLMASSWNTMTAYCMIMKSHNYSNKTKCSSPDKMEYAIRAFSPLSLSVVRTCTTEVPMAAVSNTRPSNESARNSGAWSLWSIMFITTRARLLLDGVPWSRTIINNSWCEFASRFSGSSVVMMPVKSFKKQILTSAFKIPQTFHPMWFVYSLRVHWSFKTEICQMRLWTINKCMIWHSEVCSTFGSWKLPFL